MKPGLDGRRRNAEKFRDLPNRSIVDVEEKEDDALVLRQFAHRRVDPPAKFAPLGDFMRERIGGGDFRRFVERRVPVRALAKDPVALVMEEGSEPAGERRRVVQVRKAKVRLDESVLRRVFGEMMVPQLRVSGGVRHVLKSPDDLLEGGAIFRLSRPRQLRNASHRFSSPIVVNVFNKKRHERAKRFSVFKSLILKLYED
jgi:hypothetical protein